MIGANCMECDEGVGDDGLEGGYYIAFGLYSSTGVFILSVNLPPSSVVTAVTSLVLLLLNKDIFDIDFVIVSKEI